LRSWRLCVRIGVAEAKGLGDIEAERRRISAALERLADLYLWGDIERAAYKQQQAVLEAELSALVVPEQTAITEAGRYLKQVGVLWDDADIGQRRELLHAILDCVKVDVLAQRVVCVKPKPEFVPLFRRVDDLEEDDVDHCGTSITDTVVVAVADSPPGSVTVKVKSKTPTSLPAV
jgi:hypothetical protein